MPRLYKTMGFVLSAGLLLGCFAFGPAADAQSEDQEARKAKILANLKLHFPPLADAQVTVGDITATEFDGLDQGTFTVAGRQTQTVAFFVSADDTKFYMVNNLEPLDVSKSAEEIEEQLAEKAAEEAEAATERAARLATAIEGKPIRGNAEGVVTIVEFSDFQCPYCARGADTVEQLLEQYPNDIKFVFMHYPLGFHPWARPAAIATECAANQSDEYFWLLHDKYFEDQKALNTENVLEKTRGYLEGSGIDMASWTACAEDTDSDEYKAAAAKVGQEMSLGQSMGVSGTPGFLVNGQLLSGAQPVSAFVPIIEAAKGGSGT
ncbi:MAG: DsbA family protein [Thermoanaerobaculia bacterium]|nr:DsbA family protein [Thermoanaerobaculia bacterium]